MQKIKKILICTFIILIIIILGYQIFKSSFILWKKQKEFINKTENIHNDLGNIVENIETHIKELDLYSKTNINNLKKDLEDNSFNKIQDTNNITNQIIVKIEKQFYVRNQPKTYEEAMEVIQVLEKSINELNDIYTIQKDKYKSFLELTAERIIITQTNVVELKKEIIEYTKPKAFSFGIGLDFDYNGHYKGEMFYDIAAHGMIFIAEKFYIGARLGVNYNMIYTPKVGLFAGMKF